MRKLFALATAAVVLAIGGSAAWAIGPSFDCAAVQNPGAQIVCSSPELSRTELSLMQAYYALRWQVGPAGWPLLRQEDLDFQSQVPQQCGLPKTGPLPSDTADTAACMQHAYEHQRDTWMSRLTGLGAEEAARRLEIHVVLQRALRQSGFLPSTETVDGIYGTTTRTAISAWQHANGRPNTGFLSHADAATLLAGQVAPTTPASPATVSTLPPIARPAAQGSHASMWNPDFDHHSDGGSSNLGRIEAVFAHCWASMRNGGLVIGLGTVLVVLVCGAVFRSPSHGGSGGARPAGLGGYSYGTARPTLRPGMMVWAVLIALSGACLTYGPTTVYRVLEGAVARVLA
jgi:hypothetical protein